MYMYMSATILLERLVPRLECISRVPRLMLTHVCARRSLAKLFSEPRSLYRARGGLHVVSNVLKRTAATNTDNLGASSRLRPHTCTSMAARLRLVQFEEGGRRRVGVQHGASVVDITGVNPSIPTDMKTFIENWDTNISLAQSAVQQALSEGRSHVFPQGEVALKAPIHNPQKVICIGMNYVDHCTEQGIPVPKEPLLFSKFPSAITDPNGQVIHPMETECLDYEVELAFVISRRGKYIKEGEAMGHVAGFTVAHDVSARDWQMHKNGGQWLIGKTFDTFCPIGPAIVTVPSISDPHNLGIRCRLNGELVQSSNTSQLVHKTEALVSYISRFVTLEPGDIVLTGTPPGVGCFRKPPLWLKRGDVVECEIDEIGTITNVIQ